MNLICKLLFYTNNLTGSLLLLLKLKEYLASSILGEIGSLPEALFNAPVENPSPGWETPPTKWTLTRLRLSAHSPPCPCLPGIKVCILYSFFLRDFLGPSCIECARWVFVGDAQTSSGSLCWSEIKFMEAEVIPSSQVPFASQTVRC